MDDGRWPSLEFVIVPQKLIVILRKCLELVHTLKLSAQNVVYALASPVLLRDTLLSNLARLDCR